MSWSGARKITYSRRSWVPGASLKSLRFGWWRFQHCPVGNHWSLVTPVKESDLTEEEKRIDRAEEDIRIP